MKHVAKAYAVSCRTNALQQEVWRATVPCRWFCFQKMIRLFAKLSLDLWHVPSSCCNSSSSGSFRNVLMFAQTFAVIVSSKKTRKRRWPRSGNGTPNSDLHWSSRYTCGCSASSRALTSVPDSGTFVKKCMKPPTVRHVIFTTRFFNSWTDLTR